MKPFGGNLLTRVDFSAGSQHVFASDPYFYCFRRLGDGEKLEIPLESFCVFFLRESVGFSKGDALIVEGKRDLAIEFPGGAEVLIAGVTRSRSGRSSTTVMRASDLKKVSKPWGYELWINGEHPDFALKRIWIRKGHKTSLQYHRMKRETNLLFEGSARLYFKDAPSVSNDDARNADLGSTELEAQSVIDVFPNTLHRLEALTDILLYETSTPHLDDVVRVQDDSNRENGRILSEHR